MCGAGTGYLPRERMTEVALMVWLVGIEAGIDGKVNSHYICTRSPMEAPMASQAVTAKGQVTLKRDLLQHLGVKPGERIDFDKLPGGELRLRAARPTGTIDGFLGLLAGKTKKVATLEEINEAAASGWAGKE